MRRNFCYLAFLLVILLSTKASGYTEQDCIHCHGKKDKQPGQYVDMDALRGSVHGNLLSCLDCHKNINDERHIDAKDSEKVDCQVCHEQHNLHAPNKSVKCISCHPPHLIYRANDVRSSVYWKNLRATCGKCHSRQTRRISFWGAFKAFRVASHPKQDFSKRYDISMCTGCHQGSAAHGEIEPINQQDCYKCHMPLAKKRIISGYIHPKNGKDKKLINSVADYLFIAIAFVFIVFIVGSIVRVIRS